MCPVKRLRARTAVHFTGRVYLDVQRMVPCWVLVGRNAPDGVFFSLARGLLSGCESILMCSGGAYFPFCQWDWFLRLGQCSRESRQTYSKMDRERYNCSDLHLVLIYEAWSFVVQPCVISCAEKQIIYFLFFWITAQKAGLPDWKMICLLKENQSGRVLFWFCAQWISYWCDVCCASAFMRPFQHHLRSLHNIIQTKLFWGNILGIRMSSSDCVKGT